MSRGEKIVRFLPSSMFTTLQTLCPLNFLSHHIFQLVSKFEPQLIMKLLLLSFKYYFHSFNLSFQAINKIMKSSELFLSQQVKFISKTFSHEPFSKLHLIQFSFSRGIIMAHITNVEVLSANDFT